MIQNRYQKEQPFGENAVLLLITVSDAWLLPMLNICLILLSDHSQLGSGWVGASGQKKEILTRTVKGWVRGRTPRDR